MRKLVAMTCLLPLLLVLGVLPARAQLSIHAGLFRQDIQVLYLHDLDLTSLNSGPPLFYVNMRNDSQDNRQVILRLVVESDNPDYGRIAEGASKPFWLGHGETRTITNKDLSESGGDIELADYTIYDSAKKLADAIFATGKLPSGIYRFILTLSDVNDPTISDQATVELNITNPTTIQLVSPGALVEEGEVPTIFSTLPQFVWDSNAREFEFTVCEKLPSNSSPEDVMQNEPRYRTRTNEKSLIYPSSGAYPLEEGHTYYWQVKAIVPTSSGTVELESEIWGFKIGSTGGEMAAGGAAAGTMSPIFQNVLSSVLGDNAFGSLFGEGGELFNCTPTGKIYYKGQPITMQDLQALLQDIRSGKLEVVDFRIE